ncbi:glycosyltransferase [Paraglaciecola arctica]|uniref:glycosyltransferase n=1 Tax=Paraglaciecola arctica TaxID=1128911 RepID=UPI001C073C5E|nr:glycosyltransferase [Paraglaciecola arctica]MBU3004209.1 glycosyltransferase [Paraglaciecola arctica]
MNIAYIFMGYPAQSEAFGQVEIKGLKKLGVNVDIYSLSSKNKKLVVDDYCTYYKFSLADLKIMFLFLPKFIYFAFKTSGSISEFLKLTYLYLPSLSIAKKICINKYDVVHLFWGHYPSLINFHLKNFNSDTKVSTFLGAYDLLSNLGISKWGVNNSDLVTTHCNFNLVLLNNICRKKVTVLYRGIDILPQNLNVKNELRICFAGRLIKSKGADKAIELLALLNKYDSFHLDICGEGSESSTLMLLAEKLNVSDKVVFHGHVPQSELFDIMRNSTLFILPTSHNSERLPNVIKEAINNNSIPLTTYTPGIAELIPERLGLILDFDDMDSVLSRAKLLLMDNSERIRVLIDLYDGLCQDFDNEKLSKKRLQYFKGY